VGSDRLPQGLFSAVWDRGPIRGHVSDTIKRGSKGGSLAFRERSNGAYALIKTNRTK